MSASVLTKKGCIHSFIHSSSAHLFFLKDSFVLFSDHFACYTHMCTHHLLACCLRRPIEHHQILWNWSYTMTVVSHCAVTGNQTHVLCKSHKFVHSSLRPLCVSVKAMASQPITGSGQRKGTEIWVPTHQGDSALLAVGFQSC